MILNAAVTVFALWSVASHVTRVLPSGKRLPDSGRTPTGTTPSVSSWAVTLKVTRALFAPFFALTVLLVAPEIVGCVVLNSYPETFSVPVQISLPDVCAPSSRVDWYRCPSLRGTYRLHP